MAEARVERRLAAILAADIAGYSRLMGSDEEGTLAAIKACRRELIDPKLAEHRGRIVNLRRATSRPGTLMSYPAAPASRPGAARKCSARQATIAP